MSRISNVVSATLTRPNDTNAYAANDVIGAATGSTSALTFSNVGQPGMPVCISDASLRIDVSTVASGVGNYRLYLYSITPPSAYGDNAAWDLPAGDRDYFLGFIDLGTPVDLGSTIYVESSGVNKTILLPDSGNLYAYLVTTAAYTPAALTVDTIRISTIGV
jgi:hypothetical protein